MIGEKQMVRKHALANALLRGQLKRNLSIHKASNIVVDEKQPNKSPVSSHILELSSDYYRLPSEAVFDTIGQTQSTLSLTVPPSVPVHVKRGSLMALFTATETKASMKDIVQSRLEAQEPLKRFAYGGHTSLYQRLISTVPVTLLISAYDSTSVFRRSKTSKTFCTLSLDGSVDWALFNRDSVQAYTGNSLTITIQKLPRSVSKAGVRKFGLPKNSTPGLTGTFSSGYKHVAGRGYVSLVGEGSIFRVNLNEDEEILVKKDNLFAASIGQIQDLEDGYFVSQILDKHLQAEEEEEVRVIDTRQEESVFSKAKELIYRGWNNLHRKQQSLFDTIIGNGSYINVRGPRILLIQANTGKDRFVIGSCSSVSTVEKYIKKGGFTQPPKPLKAI
ncbi:hypothetical protein KL948_002308 [Ogataea haglerorum]|nr:hypothetical protein KL948_002308 [Ogataea haglerorum]KAG7811280.1 hypothetical protein KL924_001946 [Ogataea haglerorum]